MQTFSSIHTYIHFPTFIFHLISQFTPETTITWISHGLGDSIYLVYGGVWFELCEARGGVLNIGSFEHWKLNRIGKDYIITIKICTVVVVLFFTHLQGARTALAKRELHWYLPNRVRQIPT